MGRTPKPLKILVHPSIAHWEELEALRAQGHVVLSGADQSLGLLTVEDFDVHLGPTCWRMDQARRPYLKLAIAAARKQRYPGKPGILDPEETT